MYLLVNVLERELADKVAEGTCFVLLAVFDHLGIDRDVERQRSLALLVYHIVRRAQTQRNVDALTEMK